MPGPGGRIPGREQRVPRPHGGVIFLFHGGLAYLHVFVDTSCLTAPELIASFSDPANQWMISLFLLVLSLFIALETSGHKTFPVERKTVNIVNFEDHTTLTPPQFSSCVTKET